MALELSYGRRVIPHTGYPIHRRATWPPSPPTSPSFSVKELAERLKTDPRELRKFLRSQDMGVGRGGKRYTFTSQQATQISRKFKAAQKKAAEEKTEGES